jgi:hypothetical protein
MEEESTLVELANPRGISENRSHLTVRIPMLALRGSTGMLRSQVARHESGR